MVDPRGSEGEEAPESGPTRRRLLHRATQRLDGADRQAPRRTAEWLLTEILDCDRAQVYAHSERPVPPDVAQRFGELVERRVQGEPLQHLLGYASFRGLQLQVSPDVMVPRPETETVVDRALACIENRERPRVLDVGTGSGCIALALKHERPDAVVYACDVSPDALAVARANADALQLDVQFLEADVLADEGSNGMPRDVDLLVSNPPYIPDDEADALPPVVREYDPAVALFAGDDPLRFYRALADWTRALCAPGASFVFEVHAAYADEVAALLRRERLVEICTDEDLSGRPRVVWGRRP
ncbi:MAG: peptide chain release factor N(5)-glutamine methyltransferase [Bacteroidetes bacterium SW_8_64_56]|nr:MAG: peptide chain release factor N(5)-glutamine methyltransferase [Bacteroidetes bacterium SW_8_64_56]